MSLTIYNYIIIKGKFSVLTKLTVCYSFFFGLFRNFISSLLIRFLFFYFLNELNLSSSSTAGRGRRGFPIRTVL